MNINRMDVTDCAVTVASTMRLSGPSYQAAAGETAMASLIKYISRLEAVLDKHALWGEM